MEVIKINDVIQSVNNINDQKNVEENDERFERAKNHASNLLAQLGPMFVTVASATRDEVGAQAWIDAWARQFITNKLTPVDIQTGLANISNVIKSHGHPPFSFSLFFEACRPDSHMTGQDHQTRQRHPPLITQNRLTNPDWCAARDSALSKIRAMKKTKT